MALRTSLVETSLCVCVILPEAVMVTCSVYVSRRVHNWTSSGTSGLGISSKTNFVFCVCVGCAPVGVYVSPRVCVSSRCICPVWLCGCVLVMLVMLVCVCVCVCVCLCVCVCVCVCCVRACVSACACMCMCM